MSHGAEADCLTLLKVTAVLGAANDGPAESSSHASTFSNSIRVHPGLSDEL